jgi:two-component system, NtrC family, nitrogen regulation response regulator NtrX
MATDLPSEAQHQVGPAEEANGHEPTVLVVEDDEDTRFAMSQVLAQEGYLVLTAATGHDAIATLREPLSRIDVVLLDVHLPDVNGTELCSRLRELYPDLPVVVCSGEADSEEIAELVRLGAIRYFRKPVTVDELLSTVESALP